MINNLKKLFGIDLRVLAVFRIGLALLIILDLILRYCHLEELYTDRGLLNRQDAIRYLSSSLYFSFHLFNGTFEFQFLLFLISGFFAALLLVGYKTKLATIISWILMTSLHLRNLLLLDGGDYILRLSLMWCMFLPTGEHYSYDSNLKTNTSNSPQKICSIASAGLLIQIAIMYLFTAIAKFRNEEWTNGYGIYLSLNEIQYATPIGLYLTHLPDYILKVLSRSVVYFEFIGTILLFSYLPILRLITIICFIFMHILFFLCLDIGIFPLICIICLIPFLHGEILDKILDKLKFVNMERGSEYLYSGKSNNLFSLVMLVYIIFSNVDALYMKKYIPQNLNWFGEILHINQSWYMFATPGTKGEWYNLWYVIPARLKDGTEVDLFKDGNPVTFEKPIIASYYFKDRHLKKFLIAIGKSYWGYIPAYSNYLCYKWNKTHKTEKQAEYLDIYLMHEALLPNKQSTDINKRFYWRQYCE